MADLAQRTLDKRIDLSDDLPVYLELQVEDPETIRALAEYPEGEARDEYALAALKIGVLALRHASGRIDADLIQRESSRLLETLERQLAGHARQANERMTEALKDYFDPHSGRFHERVQRLVAKDGELEQVLRQQIGGDESQLARTLAAHLGEHSPLMKMLSPNESQGVLAALKQTVEVQLVSQREKLLEEFSLDCEEGALSRLVREVKRNHGELTKDLKEKIDEVVKEFSLDEDGSALSRLVKNVEEAQQTISKEFSLDNAESAFSRLNAMLEKTQGAIDRNLTLDEEQSPLFRLKRELLELLGKHTESNQKFQEEVKVALATIVAKREEMERSTHHGAVFEDAVCEFIGRHAQHAGDIATPTGHETGLIKNCKVGDCVIELGPDCAAPGARIVVEAKEKEGYTLARAREEIDEARRNRGAQMGLFVFSQKSAPPGQQPFLRYGDDLFVVWDAENPATDIWLTAGLVTTRALCVRGGRQSEAQAADFEAIDKAILDIEKRGENLEEVTKSAETIKRASENILNRARIDREALAKQVEVLREKTADLKRSLEVSGENT